MKLGRANVDLMLEEIPASMWWEWVAYGTKVNPFGEERADLRAGIVASTIANAHRNKKKRSKPYTARDFMPKVGRKKKPEQSWQEQLSIVIALNAAFGGNDERDKRPH